MPEALLVVAQSEDTPDLDLIPDQHSLASFPPTPTKVPSPGIVGLVPDVKQNSVQICTTPRSRLLAIEGVI